MKGKRPNRACHIKLNTRERATVMAALQYYSNDLDDPNVLGECYSQLATNAGALKPLNADEVEALYQRINFAPKAAKKRARA